MYVVAETAIEGEQRYRVLKIELASNNEYEGTLEDYVFDDGREYDKQSMMILLSTVHNGNKASLPFHFSDCIEQEV